MILVGRDANFIVGYSTHYVSASSNRIANETQQGSPLARRAFTGTFTGIRHGKN